MPKLSKRATNARIDRAFSQWCSGVQINIMDLSKVYARGREFVLNGADDQTLGVGLRAFVESIAVTDGAGCTFQVERL